jgi:hypothetical protein
LTATGAEFRLWRRAESTGGDGCPVYQDVGVCLKLLQACFNSLLDGTNCFPKPSADSLARFCLEPLLKRRNSFPSSRDSGVRLLYNLNPSLTL